MNTIIRPATIDDGDAVFQFVCQLEEQVFERELFDKYYAINIADVNNIYLFAEIDRKPAGYLSCHGQLLLHHMNWAYEIQELFVADDYRSAGIGAQLLQALEQILSARQYDVLEVTSNNTRTSAHNFYLKNGFTQSHQKFTKKAGK